MHQEGLDLHQPQNQPPPPLKAKSNDPNKYRTVFTLGGTWASLFKESLASKQNNILHFEVGNPKWKFTDELGAHTDTPCEESEYLAFMARIQSNNPQASEVEWRLVELVRMSGLVLLDCNYLDTAVGQFILSTARRIGVPAWAVGVDATLSPLAPAFLKGVIFPSSTDDLVLLTLREIR